MRKSYSILLGMALMGTLSACNAAPQQGQGRPAGPPPEAFEACEGMSAGDSVTFAGREGEEIAATCKEENGQLVAVPLNPPKR